MEAQHRLFAIKLLHTVIWVFFVAVIFYVLFTAITDTVNFYTWLGIALVIGEGLTLLLFKMSCPLTLVARKYSDSNKDNFDIFLPNWLARHNKLIFTSIFLLAILLVLLRHYD
jgi:cbb3-type cytochrome oxidase subunit 1